MSLYNQILGFHPFAKHLISMLGIHPNEYGRFRDIYLKKDEEKLKIIVFTRNGGGNREQYQSVFDKLSKHPNYLKDYDDDNDSTYANIEFSIPNEYQQIAEEIFTVAPEERGLNLFKYVIENMNSSQNPFAERALQVGQEIIKKINDSSQNDGPTIINV